MAGELAALVQAVADGDVERARKLLESDPSLARQQHGGASPLHYAAIHNQRAAVDLLLDHGANVEDRDTEFGAQPIGWANERGHMEMVRYLHSRGTSVTLHTAAAFGLTAEVERLAESQPDQLDEVAGYGAPLHLAALWGHPEVVQILLARGADPLRRNQDGELAMVIANRQALSGAAQTPLVTPERREEIIEGCRRAAEILRGVTTERV